MSDYDDRQLSLMSEKINKYRGRKIDLGTLVRDLEALLNVLESTSNEWKEAFHEEWWNLEQVFAVALDRNDDSVLSENEELISKSLSQMEALIKNN